MGVFDIIGPIMIGPSSSHTAGAARIGRVTRGLLGEDVLSCDIALSGSFAATASGHGTDRAIVAGLMGMEIDDPKLRDSFSIAKRRGMDFRFSQVDIYDAHPNTAVITANGKTHTVKVRASSVGGGAISVDELNGFPVSFSGASHTLIILHNDRPGVIASVSKALANDGINIATMQVFRETMGGRAVMAIEMDEYPGDEVVPELKGLPGVKDVSLLRRI